MSSFKISYQGWGSGHPIIAVHQNFSTLHQAPVTVIFNESWVNSKPKPNKSSIQFVQYTHLSMEIPDLIYICITPRSPNNPILFDTHLSMNFLLSLALGMIGSSMLSAKVTVRYSHCPVWLTSIRSID